MRDYRLRTTVKVAVETVVLTYVTVVVDKSDCNWREKAVTDAETQAAAAIKGGEVVSKMGDIVDE